MLSSDRLILDGSQVLSIHDSTGDLLGTWNGSPSEGGWVAPGAYVIRVVWTENENVLGRAQVGVVVQAAANALLRSALVAPNPAGGQGSQLVSLRWTPDGRTEWVRGRLYNLAGEYVHRGEVPANQGRQDWDLRSPSGEAVAGGVYLWHVEALSGGKVLERRVLKFVVVR